MSSSNTQKQKKIIKTKINKRDTFVKKLNNLIDTQPDASSFLIKALNETTLIKENLKLEHILEIYLEKYPENIHPIYDPQVFDSLIIEKWLERLPFWLNILNQYNKISIYDFVTTFPIVPEFSIADFPESEFKLFNAYVNKYLNPATRIDYIVALSEIDIPVGKSKTYPYQKYSANLLSNSCLHNLDLDITKEESKQISLNKKIKLLSNLDIESSLKYITTWYDIQQTVINVYDSVDPYPETKKDKQIWWHNFLITINKSQRCEIEDVEIPNMY